MRAGLSKHPQLSRNPPPACLWKENPNRLVTLLDIVNLFDCRMLHVTVKNLNNTAEFVKSKSNNTDIETLEAGVRERARLRGQALSPVMEANLTELKSITQNRIGTLQDIVRSVVADLKEFCEANGLYETIVAIRFAENHLLLNPNEFELASDLRHLEEALYVEVCKSKFLCVDSDLTAYLDQDALFGTEVKVAFPSGTRDLREGGNCLAADCGTGSVFHAMRAGEICLRLLATDRGIAYANSSVENKQWGQLLVSRL